MRFASYKAVVDAKVAERDRLLAQALPFSEDQNEILNSTAAEIVARIEQGDWTASQVVEAYIARAAYAQSKANCLTEILFEPARKLAKELDNEFAATKKLRGPLHGVPFSLKDQIDVAGFDTTIGFTQWANKPATEHAAIVKLLISAGAIPIVKTNVPQTMFAFECNNPLWGRTLNPYSTEYTCGGSSGGEAALIASDGSVFGIGSDIGGSLRIPAAYCGIYSLKPGCGRISHFGSKGPTPGFEGLRTVLGPMSRSVSDLELICKTTFGVQNPADYNVIPIPYRPVELPPKLHFGYYTTSGWVRASPAVKRAISETVQALRNAGHTCTEFQPPDVFEAMCIFVGLTSSDAYKTMLSNLGPDPMDRSIWLVTFASKLPGFIRYFASWLVETFFGDKLFAEVARHTRAKPFDEYLKYTDWRNKLNTKFYDAVWNKYKFDGIICPVQALPQLPHGGCTELSSIACETFYYNVVDQPVGCLPVTRVTEADELTDEWKTAPTFGSSLMDSSLYRGKKPWYNPKKMVGMPVGIQIVGKRWEEEKVLAMMQVVDEAVRKDNPHTFGPRASERVKM